MSKLVKTNIIKGVLTCETGLHIGGAKDNLKIGGLDSPVIKHPITDEPYIPGSSLKGKMRSLLESQEGKNVCACGACLICDVFGSGSVKTRKAITRVLFRDALISKENKTDPLITEEKYENRIDRQTGVTTSGSLRQIERVPAGTKFDYEIVVQILDTDDEKKLMELIKKGLTLLENNYLGGAGSRGYGKVTLSKKE
ncbi:MAG: type III-A CRISPR-associated RAMP protein Csm3 [Candidatus Margulisbacteria bacterium]|nr:type III-A CRISPR-associated RAMP protein Csm3 [Candidatus Margulisiibacteriota bacterium]